MKHACRRMKHFAAGCRKIWSTADAVWSKAFSGFMFFALKSRQKNGGERVSCCNLLNKLKNRIVLLQQPQVWHIMALPPYKSVLTFLGDFRGFSFFYGEEMGMFLNANQPSSGPGFKPSSLVIRRHRNIAHFYLFSTQMGNFRGSFCRKTR